MADFRELIKTVRLRFTDKNVAGLPCEIFGQKLYWDAEVRGFAVRVGKMRKVYVVQSSVRGGPRSKTVTIAPVDRITAGEARRKAKHLLAQMAQGIDPNREYRRARINSYTVDDAYREHVSTKRLRESTKRGYKRVLETYLADWKAMQLRDITRAMVVARHQEIGVQHGPYQANEVMRNLRAWINGALALHEELDVTNPVVLKGRWYKQKRRQGHIAKHDLPAWFNAVLTLPNQDAQDYLQLLIFTGLRKMEAAQLQWADVDLERATLTITKTKNGDPLMLPLSRHLVEMLGERFESSKSKYVFPSRSAKGFIQDPQKWVDAVKNVCGCTFTLHDLRRTFVTTAESLNISIYAIKRLVNHRLSDSDVTAGYVVMDVDRLREPMEAIAEQLLESAVRYSDQNRIASERYVRPKVSIEVGNAAV